jgi:hypothetical protein
MDFEWINGVNCLSKQTWEGWLSLWWLWTENFGKSCLPAKHEHRGVHFIGVAGRPRPTGLGGETNRISTNRNSTLYTSMIVLGSGYHVQRLSQVVQIHTKRE